MNILALDTSSDACSAAVLTDSGCHAQYVVEPRAHTRLILPMVEAVLQEAGLALKDMDALAFGRGPGAFTGVRIATGIVQGLALAADKPVVAVSTLAALAQQAYALHQQEKVLVAIDARMAEVYWGTCTLQDGRMQLLGEEWVLPPADTPLPDDMPDSERGTTWAAVGSGWAAYEDVLKPHFSGHVSEFYPELLPHAEHIAYLGRIAFQQGEAVSPELAQPVYLRNKVAKTSRERALNQ